MSAENAPSHERALPPEYGASAEHAGNGTSGEHAGGAHDHHDAVGARIGMWLFLFTELILFGGLFLLYAAYRSKFPDDFRFGASTLDVLLGTVNTIALLTSSLTMVLSVAALQRGDRRLASVMLALTLFLGALFLANKYFEWSAKIHHGLYPGSTELVQRAPGENLFYGLYYAMTGLHGLHVLIGMGILGAMLYLVARRPRRSVGFPDAEGLLIKLENAGLYWHLVDVIWIFLFPLFYLIS